MPAVSEKQRRAMFAAASGHSTLGIPKSVGKEFVGKDGARNILAALVSALLGKIANDDAAAEKMAAGIRKQIFPGSSDRCALDAATTRTYDADGRLHVGLNNISKANVCDYYGSEIPGYEALGLEPTKLYRLFRDPEELKKAVPTFNNLPLLSRHVPVSAENPEKSLVIGSLGTDAEFKPPYLRNSLVVWDADAIKGIQDGRQKEISCAYRYVPDMTPGTYEGQQFDGVMRQIVGNHAAVVPDGRVGADCVVGDSISHKEQNMPKAPLSRMALLAKGALTAALKPKLAADAQPDFDNLLAGITAENWEAKKPELLAQLKALKLADNEEPPDIGATLNELDADKPADDDGESPFPTQHSGSPMDPDTGTDTEPDAKLDLEQLVPLLKDILGHLKGGAEPAADTGAPEPKPEGQNPIEKKENGVDKAAMDAAISAATKKAAADATKSTMDRLNAVRAAEREVRPWVGDLAMAADSAEGVYENALKALGVSTKGIHPSAFRPVLMAQAKPGERRDTQFAADSASGTADFAASFPNVSLPRQI